MALIAVFSVISPTFRNTDNLINILEQKSIIGIVALGMLAMMISGGFDLSVGAVGAAGVVSAAYFSTHNGLTVAIIVTFALGIIVGLANGLIITRLDINPFITTFAMASIVSGIVFVMTDAGPVIGAPSFLGTIAFNKTAGVPNAFIAFMGFAVLTWFLLTQTKWGHYLYSVGSNAEASYLSGISVTLVTIGAYVFGSFAAASGALILLGQTSSGQPTAGADWPLNAIAICVIGGTSLAGGIGKVSDVVVATLLLGVLANGLNQLSVSPYWQPGVTGFVILAAVTFDRLSRRRAGDRDRRLKTPVDPAGAVVGRRNGLEVKAP